jgi:hypothetical protein
MGRHYKYRPGSFYRVDDRTGFSQRAEHTRKQWNNLIVDEKVWEPRQPQDLVRGVKDQQSVQDVRPLAPDQFVGPVWTATSYAVPIGSNLIPVASVASFSVGDQIAIMTQGDGGVLFHSTVTGIGFYSFQSYGTVACFQIGDSLPQPVGTGAQVWNYST